MEGVSLTQFARQPLFNQVKTLRNKIAAAYTAQETSHPSFPLGCRFGFAVAVVKASKFIPAHSNAVEDEDDNLNNNLEFQHPAVPVKRYLSDTFRKALP